MFLNTVFYLFIVTNGRFVATLCWALSVPYCQQHLLSSCLSCFGNSRSISDFSTLSVCVMVLCDHWYYFCNCFGVPQTATLDDKLNQSVMCSDCSTCWPFPHLLPSPRASVRTDKCYWIRPVSNPTTAFKGSGINKRQGHTSFTLN